MPLSCDTDMLIGSAKVISAIGGFLGGGSLMVFMQPKDVKDGVIRVGVSTVSAVLLAPLAAVRIFDAKADTDSQIVMGCAFGVGFIAWNVLGGIAQFFQARQGQDIVTLAKDATNLTKPSGG